jgi:hypothetical protein
MGSLMIATLFKENNAIPDFREAMIAFDSTFPFGDCVTIGGED